MTVEHQLKYIGNIQMIPKMETTQILISILVFFGIGIFIRILLRIEGLEKI
jgi:hypothetical protein